MKPFLNHILSISVVRFSDPKLMVQLSFLAYNRDEEASYIVPMMPL